MMFLLHSKKKNAFKSIALPRGSEKKCRKRQKCAIQDLNMAKFQKK